MNTLILSNSLLSINYFKFMKSIYLRTQKSIIQNFKPGDSIKALIIKINANEYLFFDTEYNSHVCSGVFIININTNETFIGNIRNFA